MDHTGRIRAEVERLKRQLEPYQSGRMHVFEQIGNGHIEEITQRVIKETESTIRIWEKILADLPKA